MKYFVGADERLRVAFEPLDGAAHSRVGSVPILSVPFGKKDHLSATNTFGGKSEIGDFIGEVVSDQKACGWRQAVEGRSSVGDALRFGRSFTESNEFDEVTLVVPDSMGEAWINLGKFTETPWQRANTGPLLMPMLRATKNVRLTRSTILQDRRERFSADRGAGEGT